MSIKKQFKNLISNPFISGSAIMVIGSNAINALNYIYHFIIGRMLGPASYGELVTLFSLIGLISVVPTSFGLVLVKFISSTEDKNEVKNLISWFNKNILLISAVLFIILTFFSSIISQYLNINDVLIIIISIATIIFSIPTFFNRSSLQGLLRFKSIVISLFGENIVKLVGGVTFVFLGFSVQGAIVALIFASFTGWFLSRHFLQDYFIKNIKPLTNIKQISLFSVPVVLQTIASTSFFSTDVILVKHFLAASDAGIYAAISTYGKIILFATTPIAGVMFPLIAKKHTLGDKYLTTLILSIIATAGVGIVVTILYKLIPGLLIKTLYGDSFLAAVDLLFLFGIFMTIYSIGALMVNFYLSINRPKAVFLSLACAFLQIIGICLFHDNLFQVIYASIASAALLLFGLIVYFVYVYQTQIGFSHNSRL